VVEGALDGPPAAQCRMLGAAAVGVDAVLEQERDALGVRVVVGDEDERVLHEQLRLGQMRAEPCRPGSPPGLAESVFEEELEVLVVGAQVAL
jgi:hypothetical protein